MNRKEAMEILEGKTTQELLSKQMFWQFQIAAIEDGSEPRVKKRLRQLKKELSWIQEVVASRPDTKYALSQKFGTSEGEMRVAEVEIASTSWDQSRMSVSTYDEEAIKQKSAANHPRVKVVHNKPGKPPKQIIGVDTLDIKAKHGFEP